MGCDDYPLGENPPYESIVKTVTRIDQLHRLQDAVSEIYRTANQWAGSEWPGMQVKGRQLLDVLEAHGL